jgi:hypothetical protein
MQAAAITPVTSPVETEVLRIRELIERNQFAAALSAAPKGNYLNNNAFFFGQGGN